MKILAFGAHPDDVEFGCGGVLLEQIAYGHEVAVVCLTLGEAGSSGTPVQRKQETELAVKMLGARVDFWDIGGDCHIEYTNQNRLRIARKIREECPDIILIPTLDQNQHPDHRIVAELVRDASRLARYKGLQELLDLPAHAVGSIWHFPVLAFPEHHPDVIVDVSNVIDQWREAMMCHESQMKHKNYLELILGRSRTWGLSAGVEYGIALWKSAPLVMNNLAPVQNTARSF